MSPPVHPQARFDPFPPDLDLPKLVDSAPRFRWAQRITWQQIETLGQERFEKLVLNHVIQGGKPLVIEGWESDLSKEVFSAKWLENHYGDKHENVRDLVAGRDTAMTMGHYLRSMPRLTDQHTPSSFRSDRCQRLYLKDVDCPKEWHSALQTIIHPSVFYLNENVTSHGSQSDEASAEETPAPAGDLMSSLPPDMRAENLMCYIGHEGTYTPAHREMCASLGHNIMVDASGSENGEKPGSSIWFMTESKDREVVREYFLSMLGHDIEIEKHFAQINAWKRANFDVHVVEQRPGDFILVPPLAAHQVWNRGTRTIKVAWNRTTPETLSMALNEALPKARLVCRDEQYKNKALVYYTLAKYAKLLTPDEDSDIFDRWDLPFRKAQVATDFKTLFGLFAKILLSELLHTEEKQIEFIPFGSYITCSFCRGNVFNRFLTCKSCIRKTEAGDDDTYDVCMECYTMGRSCACASELSWCEQWDWADLVAKYEEWRGIVIANDGYVDVDTSPQPVEIAAQRMVKKSLARICQEELKRRSGQDFALGSARSISEEDSDAEKTSTKKRQARRRQKKGNVANCHVCAHKEYTFKMAKCSNEDCNESYCYGSLYRAFDEMPVAAMEDKNWQCPKCRKICYCGSCRRAGNSNYTPTKTCLGYDTLTVADDRSVEALVNFRLHNFAWLKAVGEESRSQHSRRMLQLREAADNTKTDDDESTFMAEVESLSIEAAKLQYAAHLQAQEMQSINASAQADMPSHAVGLYYFDGEDAMDRILFSTYHEEPLETAPYSAHHLQTHSQEFSTSGEATGEQDDSMEHFVSSSPLKKPDTAVSEPESEALEAMDPALFNEPLPLATEPELIETQPEERTAVSVSSDSRSGTDDESPMRGYLNDQGDGDEEMEDASGSVASVASPEREESMTPAVIGVPEDAQLVSDDDATRPMEQDFESPEPAASPETPEEEGLKSTKRSIPVDASEHVETIERENHQPAKYQKTDVAAEEPESVQSPALSHSHHLGQSPMSVILPNWFGMLPRTRRPQSESDTSDDEDIPAKILSAEEIEQARLKAAAKAEQEDDSQSCEDGEARARGRGRGRGRGTATARASGRGRGWGSSRGAPRGSSSRGGGRGRGRGRGRGSRGSRGRGSRTHTQWRPSLTVLTLLAAVASPASAEPAKWYAPAKSDINNLDKVIDGSGIYGYIYNTSQTPAAKYGVYNWCNMPHARKTEYPKASDEYELQYVELMHRHHKRTPYASNAFPVESYHWDCNDSGLFYYGEAFSGHEADRVYQAGYISPINPFVPSGWIGTCKFPQITAGGLDDSWQHGADLFGVYHDLLGFLPGRGSGVPKNVRYRVTNNVITSQVAGMVVNGMWQTTENTPLMIQGDGIDSLEPQYSCNNANSLFNSIKSGDNAAWKQHLDRAAPLYATLDDISGVPPNDGGFHASFDHYYDNLSARQCHDKPLPCKLVNGKNSTTCVSEEQAEAVYRLGHWEYSQIYRDNSNSLSASAGSLGVWVLELASHIREVVAGKRDVIYFHNVAHDGSVSRLLSILQIDTMVWPGMGSEVVFEIYRKKASSGSGDKCNHDNCLRHFIRATAEATSVCGTVASATSWPSECGSQSRVASACSCLGLPATKTSAPAPTATPIDGQYYVRVLFGGKILKSSHPDLGVIDMVPVQSLLNYFDNLVGKSGSDIKASCQ